VRHFESIKSACLALLGAALAYNVIACSSDSDHGPPIGAPNVPVVVVGEGGGVGQASGGQFSGGGADATGIGTIGTGGSLTVGTAGSDVPGFAGGTATGFAGGSSVPPFGSGGTGF
jgi:hypothetical protein